MTAATSLTVAEALATMYGAVTPPGGEAPISLKSHKLVDVLEANDLPAILVWPPSTVPIVQSGLDRSELTYQVILYLPRATKTTQARIDSLYAWAELLRVYPQVTASHLGLTELAEAHVESVVINDPQDTTYGVVDYDTIRSEVFAKLQKPATWIP